MQSVLMTTALLVLLSSAVGASGTGSISGTVLDAVSHAPVVYASVVLRELRMWAMTTEDGTFRIEGVPAGRHVLHAASVAHRVDSASVTVHPGRDTPVVMTIELKPSLRRDPIPIDLGRSVRLVPGQLTCELRPARSVFKVGERPEFIATIRNNGPTSVVLVYSADGSPFAARYPVVTIEEEGPDTGIEIPEGVTCGNVNGLRFDDFVEVSPGSTFDPFERGWRAPIETHGTARTPGRHVAVFRYSTDERNGRNWIGWPSPQGVSQNLARLFERVPPVTLEARTEFVVEE